MPTTITIHIRSSSESKASVSIDVDSATVHDLKSQIESVLPDFPSSAQRLIFSGKVLKDDDLLSVYKIADGNTVHVVKSIAQQPAQQPAPTTPTAPSVPPTNPFAAFAGGAGGASMLGGGQQPDMASMLQMMNTNPAMMDVMTQQMQHMFNNPQLLDAMSSMNPALANPEYRTMMQSMMANPEALRAVMALANPTGGPAFAVPPPALNPFATMPQPAAPAMAPEDRYATQLQQLAEMGMLDGERNLRALQLSGGNVNAAIEWLFNNPQ